MSTIIHFKVDGMHCDSCVALIIMELEDIGATDIELNLKTGLGSATFDKDADESILAAIERAGYCATITS